VTQRASLVLGGLVVERRDTRRLPGNVGCMAPQAKEVDVIHNQQPRIGRSMWGMAVHAALAGLDRCVLEHERAHLVGVAFGTDIELPSRCPELTTGLRAVGVVAVAALDNSGLDAMPVGPGEFRLLGLVATEA